MSARAPSLIPVRLGFPGAAARQDSWGRLLSLTAGGASLSTAAPLVRGEGLSLSFELGGERFRGVAARVSHVETDADGHTLAELRFHDELERRRLAKTLLDVLSRS